MNRFPLLTTFRGLLQIAAVFIIIVGFFGGISQARDMADTTYNSQTGKWEQGFHLFIFLTIFLLFSIIGITLLVLAELIQLGLSIEDHLYRVGNDLHNLTTTLTQKPKSTTISTQKSEKEGTPSAPQNTDKRQRCPHCGKWNDAWELWCADCGESLK